MKRLIFGLMIALVVLSMTSVRPAAAQSPWPPICQEGSLPSHDPQYPDDQLILTCIPPNWNGQLVMYAHGYVPEQFPLALPVTELYMDGTFVPDFVLAQGFAFATTSYHKNGYAVEQARKDLNDLINYFKTLVPPGSLQKVLLIGASEGGEIAALMIEHFPDKYDGALAMCGPIGSGQYQVQYLTDFRVVFDTFFPDVFSFGAADVPENAYLSWDSYIIPATAMALTANPGAAAQLYSVSKAALDPGDPSSIVISAVRILRYSIFATNDLIATAGGMPYDNQTTVYSGSLDDAALNAGVERVQSDGRARAYMRRFYQTTGELKRPLVTMHNTLDPDVPFQHELIYQGLAAGAGSSNFLTLIPVPGYGHCSFTIEQVAGAFGLLVQQVSAQ